MNLRRTHVFVVVAALSACLLPAQTAPKISTPKEALGYANLGLTYLRASRFAEAETQLRRAREIDPSNAEVGLTTAKLLSVTGRGGEARTTLEQLARTHSDNAHVLYGTNFCSRIRPLYGCHICGKWLERLTDPAIPRYRLIRYNLDAPAVRLYTPAVPGKWTRIQNPRAGRVIAEHTPWRSRTRSNPFSGSTPFCHAISMSGYTSVASSGTNFASAARTGSGSPSMRKNVHARGRSPRSR